MPSRGKVIRSFGRRRSPLPTLWRAAKDPRLSRVKHPSRRRGAKSFADDLVEDRGVVPTRAVSHCDVLKVSLQIYDLFATALHAPRRTSFFFTKSNFDTARSRVISSPRRRTPFFLHSVFIIITCADARSLTVKYFTTLSLLRLNTRAMCLPRQTTSCYNTQDCPTGGSLFFQTYRSVVIESTFCGPRRPDSWRSVV